MSISGAHTFTGTITASNPTPQPVPLQMQCFLCLRKGTYILATTYYQGTALCAGCTAALPNTLVINELGLP